MVKFGTSNDVEYYKGIFVEAGCPSHYAEFLAKGHLGIVQLATRFDKDLKNFMLQGYPHATAKKMAEEEKAWK